MARSGAWPLLGILAACGQGSGTSAAVSARRDDAGPPGTAVTAEAAAVPAPLVLGLAAVDAFDYRKRAGHAAFKRARVAEAGSKWTEVATACRQALAADPTHLDAAYLLAVALAKTDAAPAAILEPLSVAIAGDYLKWGAAVVEQPALQAMLATPAGTAWKTHVIEARGRLTTSLARAVLVTAHGDLYAFDPIAARWYRLSRTGGAIVAALRVKSKLAYLSRPRSKSGGKGKIAIGVVDLAAGRTKKLAEMTAYSESIRLAFNQQPKVNAFIVYNKGWFAADDSTSSVVLRPLANKDHAGALANLSEKAAVDVRGRTATMQRLSLPNISADFDDKRLASALKIDSSKRIVTVPSPGMIAGNTVTWSPDRSQLAFVAQLTDECKPGETTSAVFVADAATGTAREVERAAGGMATEWVADRKLVIAGDKGVAIYDGTQAMLALEGADGLALARQQPTCSAPAESDPTEPVGEPADDADDSP